jgi:hypothetical protein
MNFSAMSSADLQSRLHPTRPQITADRLAAWSFAVATGSGTFSALDIVPGLLIPKIISEPRYLFLLIAALCAAALIWQEKNIRRPVELLISGALAILFLAFSIFTTISITGLVPPYSKFESIILFTSMIVLSIIVFRDHMIVREYIIASVTIFLLAALAVFLITLFSSGPHPPFRSFSSKMLFFGSTFGLYLISSYDFNRAYAFLGILACVFMMYVGLASIMRSAVIFYLISFYIVILFLFAKRAHAAAILTILVCITAYSFFAATNGVSLQQKVSKYSLAAWDGVVISEDSDTTASCLKSIEEAAGRKLSAEATQLSCSRNLRVVDTDNRIRMILYALQTTQSPIFGSGVGTYQFYDSSQRDGQVRLYTYPHNLLIEIYYNSGVLGLLLLGGSLFFVSIGALRTLLLSAGQRIEPRFLLLAVPINAGLMSLVGGDIYDATFLWLGLIVITCLERAPYGEGQHPDSGANRVDV